MQHLIGKHLIIRGPFGRDESAKRCSKVVEIGGVCDYIGPNKFMDMELVVVLDRMPIQLTHINQIIKVH